MTMSKCENSTFFEQALFNVLAKYDESQVDHYFTDDAVIMINEKALAGKESIRSRIKWLSDNLNGKHVKIELLNVFFNGNEGFDHHTSTMLNDNGEEITFKVFGYIVMKDGKISRYEDLTIQVQGQEAMAYATSTSLD